MPSTPSSIPPQTPSPATDSVPAAARRATAASATGAPATVARATAATWADRAEDAARSVVPTFGRPVWGLPGTHLAVRCVPAPGPHDLVWNYWWQAHYLDAIVDAGLRHAAAGRVADARSYAELGTRVLRSVRIRNFGDFANDFFDDMAWLVLATDRLRTLWGRVGEPAPGVLDAATRRITGRLRSAHTDDLGGGLFWTTKRDRKNVPATAPAAMHFARTGETSRAYVLTQWIFDTLGDPATGLVKDTIFTDGRIDAADYTYNQGIALGALLALGDDASLRHAERLVDAVAAHECVPGAPGVLRTQGGGDGGLFTGILVRYLALAATDERLAPATRTTAAAMVLGTADRLWSTSSRRDLGGRPWPVCLFATDSAVTCDDTPKGAGPVELSPQLQAWTMCEAAALVTLRSA